MKSLDVDKIIGPNGVKMQGQNLQSKIRGRTRDSGETSVYH
jgi:hypothetical protein